MKIKKTMPETKPSEIEELIERVKSGNLRERAGSGGEVVEICPDGGNTSL